MHSILNAVKTLLPISMQSRVYHEIILQDAKIKNDWAILSKDVIFLLELFLELDQYFLD